MRPWGLLIDLYLLIVTYLLIDTFSVASLTHVRQIITHKLNVCLILNYKTHSVLGDVVIVVVVVVVVVDVVVVVAGGSL